MIASTVGIPLSPDSLIDLTVIKTSFLILPHRPRQIGQ